jgi:hypothetical protein
MDALAFTHPLINEGNNVKSNELKFPLSSKLYQDDKEGKTVASASNNLEYGPLNTTINHTMKCQATYKFKHTFHNYELPF